MSKISVRVGFKDLDKNNPPKIVLGEFDSVHDMNSFLFHQGVPKGVRVLCLVRNLEDDFEEGLDDQIA